MFGGVGQLVVYAKSHLPKTEILLTILGELRPSQQTRHVDSMLMLAHRLRRWTNISPALGQRAVFAVIE